MVALPFSKLPKALTEISLKRQLQTLNQASAVSAVRSAARDMSAVERESLELTVDRRSVTIGGDALKTMGELLTRNRAATARPQLGTSVVHKALRRISGMDDVRIDAQNDAIIGRNADGLWRLAAVRGDVVTGTADGYSVTRAPSGHRAALWPSDAGTVVEIEFKRGARESRAVANLRAERADPSSYVPQPGDDIVMRRVEGDVALSAINPSGVEELNIPPKPGSKGTAWW